MTLVVAICILAAALLLVPAAPRHRLGRLKVVEPIATARTRLQPVATVLAVVGVGVGGLIAFGSAGAAVGFCLALVAATVAGLWRRHRRESQALRLAEEVVDGCQLLAGLLRVGHVPAMALRLAATDTAVFAEAQSAQQVGGSVPAVLRRQGGRPGGAGLTELAIAWEIAESTGASMTATLDALTDRLDAARKVARLVNAELAAPRATGRLLAALPLFGLLLGYAIGGDPGHFLLDSLLGQGCLVLGVGLACVGVWWIEKIAGSAGG
jgi:tight adherence protein B